MLKTIAITLALTFAASSVGATPMLDAKGKCRDNGKFVSSAMCKAAAPAAAASGSYTLDAKGHCHDAKGKMAKKEMCAGSATASAAAPAAPAASATSMASAAGGPKCVKGQRCGNACISVKDKCHKP